MKQKTSEELYNEINNDENGEIKIQWKKALEERKKLNRIALIICIIVDIIAIYFLIDEINMRQRFIAQLPIQFTIFEYIWKVIPIVVIDIIIYSIVSLFGKEQKNYKKTFKENIIKKILCNFYDNLEYFPEKQISERIYDEPGYEDYNNYYSDDYMEAVLDNKYSIQMAEVETEKEEIYEDGNGNKQTRTINLFHGIFVKVDMEKSINSNLNIQPNVNFNVLKKNKLEMDSRRI